MNPLLAWALGSPLVARATHLQRRARDGANRLLGRQDPLVPPLALMHDGPASVAAFKRNGREFFDLYLQLCGLRPYHRMLDVGCGIGRKTVPLIDFLTAEGGYDGIDIVAAGIEWCQKAISAHHPHFRFQRIDVFNPFYNPGGRHTAATFTFPFPSSTFDVAVAGSVFTHLQAADTTNYVHEIARTLKPGGRCLLSFFLLDEESRSRARRRLRFHALRFDHALPGCFTIDPRVPERAIAYDESIVVRTLAAAGLQIEGPIHYGGWCGRSRHLSWQDLVVARKATDALREPGP